MLQEPPATADQARMTQMPTHATMGSTRTPQLRTTLSIAATLLLLANVQTVDARSSRIAEAPEIFFLGDSHLSFGAGRVFQSFFQNFEKNCKSEESWPGQAQSIENKSFSLMGVKSTAIHTWLSRHQSLRKMICVPDPKWPVNARLYGFPHREDGTYVQLGKDPSFPFCERNESGFDAVFRWGKPELLILYFMGNTITRWKNSPKAAARDVQRLMKQLPNETGCVFMTTSPVYRKDHNAERYKAQVNIQAAFEKHGKPCAFVPMLTKQTIAAIQGQSKYFSRRKDGRVKDPYHPLGNAARRLIELRREPLCRAVMQHIKPGLLATVKD